MLQNKQEDFYLGITIYYSIMFCNNCCFLCLNNYINIKEKTFDNLLENELLRLFITTKQFIYRKIKIKNRIFLTLLKLQFFKSIL